MSQGNNTGVWVQGSGNATTVHGDAIGQVTGQVTGRVAGRRRGVDVGVLTVINEEMQAVVDVLRSMPGYDRHRIDRNGPLVHEAKAPAGDHAVHVVAMQMLDRGTRPAVTSYQRLVRDYRPAVVLLVGIAGGVSPRVRVGDVVLGDQIISYDARRETPEGARRRGQSHTVPAALGHRLNEFFAAEGDGGTGPDDIGYRIVRGPIGSGDAVITDADSAIRAWLRDYHEKILAVETEAAGIAQAFHEHAESDDAPEGYLTVRGISDNADRAKGHGDHATAARHAAATMRLLLPHLLFRAQR